MKAEMTAQLVTDALGMTICRRGKPEVLAHHRDRGSRGAGERFQRLLAAVGISCSMSRTGNVGDDSARESFLPS